MFTKKKARQGKRGKEGHREERRGRRRTGDIYFPNTDRTLLKRQK